MKRIYRFLFPSSNTDHLFFKVIQLDHSYKYDGISDLLRHVIYQYHVVISKRVGKLCIVTKAHLRSINVVSVERSLSHWVIWEIIQWLNIYKKVIYLRNKKNKRRAWFTDFLGNWRQKNDIIDIEERWFVRMRDVIKKHSDFYKIARWQS